MIDQTTDQKIVTTDTDTNTDTNTDANHHTRLIPDLTSIPACDKIATKSACTFHPVSGYLDIGGELNEDWRYKIVYISDSPGTIESVDNYLSNPNQPTSQIKIRTGVLSPRTPRAFTLAHEGKIHRLVSNGVDPNIAKASLQVKYGQEFDVCYLANRILHHQEPLYLWTYLSERMLRDNRLYTRACLAYLNIDIGGMSDLRCLSAIEIAFRVFKCSPKYVPVNFETTEKVIQSGRRIADLIGRRETEIKYMNRLTTEERQLISIAKIAPSAETDQLIDIIERLIGEEISPADDFMIDEGVEDEETPEDTIVEPDLLPTIQSRLTQRAKDLSLSIIKPDTFARKLRGELISIAGPEAAITYHISAQFDSSTQQLNFQIARLSPKTAIKLQSSLNVTTLQLAYTSVTQSGWRVSIGLNAAYTGTGEERNRFRLPKEAETKIEFGVVLSK